jgi:CheY-like chemotaxis protein
VLSAGSGPEALEVLRRDTAIDLLFTDIFMPGGMHGPQLVNAAHRLRPDLKILFCGWCFVLCRAVSHSAVFFEF